MPTNSKTPRTKATLVKRVQSKQRKKNVPAPVLVSWPKRVMQTTKQKVDTFLARRPHRSFRLTRRRDYVRPLQLPGYIRFTNDVYRTVWKYKKILLPLLIVYIVFYAILVGIGSQDTYGTVADTIKQAGGNLFSGGFAAEAGQAGILFLSVASTGLT
ncbi:MAG TPA: hypothetical protein VN081_06380, partial [Dongiaceae bacterium]|nr:hypothetical protein [Dongiaceae bacterium]